MNNDITLIAQQFVKDMVTVYYTVPDYAQTIIKNVILHNTGSTPVVVTMFLVSLGDEAGTRQQFFKRTLSPLQTLSVFDLAGLNLPTGTSLWAVASTVDVVTLNAGGVEKIT